MSKVFAWPPLGALSRSWSTYAPTSMSRSLITGSEYVTAAQRKRRRAKIEVSSRFSPYQAGDGYCRALAEILDGGINCVRLRYVPRAFECDIAAPGQRSANIFTWETPPVGFGWIVPSDPFTWGAGAVLSYTITTVGGVDAVIISGLPANTLVALPGEYARFYDTSGTSDTRMVIAPATSNGSGVATVKLASAAPSRAYVSLGAYDEGVFAAVSIPVGMEPASGDWSYTWEFEEVFADEGRGPFVEVNPWT